ncbi:hypothetical protein CISIN_1g048646mg [Citrus sinensis]|uniref:Uncharacterized protein n=1 Tax=Citrus sinensis TaxID=2711 RepID=A0A067H0Q0_CITSI|nr:hypothetical protein CISIN_1g048646mg [Citrus sinensis]
MESSSVSSDDKSPWPEQIDLGIRNRVSGLNFCFEELDERLTQLMAKTEWLKDEAVAKASVLEISFLRLNLEDAKQRMNAILIENKDGGCKKEDGTHVIKKLKELIIEVFEIKCSIDLGLKVFTAIEGLEKGKEESEKGVQEFLKKDGDVMERLLGKLALNSSSGDDIDDEAVSDSELFLATLTD